MNRVRFSGWCVMAVMMMVASTARGSVDTIGPNGINSAGLGLNGDGIGIGQVEPGRPGKPGFDDGAHSNTTIIPEAVFVQDADATANDATVDEHAEEVAGVMISTDTTDPDGTGPRVAPTGVATEAKLYASAAKPWPEGGQPEAAVSAQHVALQNGGDVRAINFSFLRPLVDGQIPDGNSTLTQFVDWSAGRYQHDVLYVVSNRNTSTTPSFILPTDNFNGLTVAASAKRSGEDVYRQVADSNDFSDDAVGPRTSVGLLAPGDGIDLTGLGGATVTAGGTSYAAPHVTGTVALLQQYAESRIPSAHWDADARRHEVMKAVLMNSADKIQDDGSGNMLGMSRTVLKQDGVSTWLNSNAYTDQTIPLDIEMGAGHLNASRALTQFSAGEHDSNGTATVPLVGWDYGRVDDVDTTHKYVFDQELRGGSYVSITLAWDRDVWLEYDDGPTPGAYDPGETFYDNGFYDVNLYLLPAGATDTSTAIWASTSSDSNLEHIFHQIPQTGSYEFWVEHMEPQMFYATVDYAVAWWAVSASAPVAGDYSGDFIVDENDYNLWKADFGSTENLAADGNGNGVVDAADYTVWRDALAAGSGSLGTVAVPEPTAMALCIIGMAYGFCRYRKQD